jgi:hypothetical protein
MLNCEELAHRDDVVPIILNFKNSPLLNTEKVLLPQLHKRVGVMKKFLEVLGKGGEDFLYLGIKFPNRSGNKVKQYNFAGSQIRNVMMDENFERNFNSTSVTVWEYIK